MALAPRDSTHIIRSERRRGSGRGSFHLLLVREASFHCSPLEFFDAPAENHRDSAGDVIGAGVQVSGECGGGCGRVDEDARTRLESGGCGGGCGQVDEDPRACLRVEGVWEGQRRTLALV
jgi:hypothetical protein